MTVPEQDWGESTGARLAEAQEANNHKRYELRFQLWVLVLLSAITVVLVGIDVGFGRQAAKDMLIVILPAFTFVLGKIDKSDG